MDGNDDDNRIGRWLVGGRDARLIPRWWLFIWVLFSCLSLSIPSLSGRSFRTHNGIPMGGKLQTETGQLSGTKDMTDGWTQKEEEGGC